MDYERVILWDGRDQILMIAVTVKFAHPYLKKVHLALRTTSKLAVMDLLNTLCCTLSCFAMDNDVLNMATQPGQVTQPRCGTWRCRFPGVSRGKTCSSAGSSPCLAARLDSLASSGSFQLTLLRLGEPLENSVSCFV